MPGTLLLDDWRKSVEDRINEHVKSLQQSTQQALQAVSQPAQQVQQAVQDPAGIAARIQQHVDDLSQQTQQAAQQTLQPIGDVASRIQQHVDGLIAQQPTAAPPSGGTLQTLGASAAPTAQQGDVLGGPPSSDTATGPAAVTAIASAPPESVAPTRVGQGQSAFIESLAPLAARVSARTGIDPNVMIAIAANETGWGQSDTAKQQNNLFSIQGPSGQASRWASYDSPEQSFQAFVDLISQAPRYKQAWADRANPEQFVEDLRRAGYVVDEPGYPAQGWVDQVNSINKHLPPAPSAGLVDRATGLLDQAGRAIAGSDPNRAALPHSEEPASSTDHLGDKWKTQFDFKATYTGDYRTGTPHRGVDMVPQKGGIGTEVDAFVPGTVTSVFRDPGGAGGLIVYVQDAQGLTHAYMHLLDASVKVGDQVQRGQAIARMGESGTEGSPHLHYEVRKNASNGDPLDQLIDPRPYVQGAGQPQATGGATRAALPPSSEPGVVDLRTAPQPMKVTNLADGTDATRSASTYYNTANQTVMPTGGRSTTQVGVGPGPAEFLGGAASAIGTTARRATDALGEGANALGAALPDVTKPYTPDASHPEDIHPPMLAMPAADTPLGKMVRGQSIGNLSPQEQLGAVKDWFQAAGSARNDMIEQANPLKNTLVLGGLTSMIVQQIAAPETWLAAGPTTKLGGLGGELAARGALRAGIPELVARGIPNDLGFKIAQALPQVFEKLARGGIVGGLQNALFAVDQTGATPQSVGEALWTGAGLGGIMDASAPAVAAQLRKIGQAIIDRAPEIEAALRTRQPAQAQIGFAAGIGPGRTAPDVLHGQAVPRPGYEPGTPEHTVDTFLQDAARTQGTATPQVSAADIQAMPGMAGSRIRGLQEVRDATEAGLPAARWYQEIVAQVRQDTGQDINPREAAVLMGATGGNAGVQANYHAMLSVFDAMRQAKPDLVGLENLDVPGVMATQGFKDVLARVRADAAYIDDDMLARVMRGYRTGEVPVPSGAKLSSYTQDFLHGLSESYSPYSTQDVHQGRLFGARPDVQNNKPLPNVSQNDQAYRTMHALTNWVAREMHIPPDQAQAAGWTTFRTLWNDPLIGPELRNDRIGLSDAIRQGRASGVLDPTTMRTGGLAEVTGPRGQGAWGDKINDVRDRIKANGSYNAPPPEGATALEDIALYHPSIQSAAQQRITLDPGGFQYGTVSGPKTGISRPVGNEPAASLRELALGDQPILRVRGEVQTDANGKIPWLAPEHTVQQVGDKTYVSVVGVGDDAAHLIGSRLGADRFNHADPNGMKVGGFSVDNVAAEQRQAVVQALADRGLPVLEAGGSLRVPLVEGSERAVKRAVDAAIAEAGATDATLVHYTGETHAVRSAATGANGRVGGARGATGPSGLSAGDRLRAAVFRDQPLPPSGAVPPGTGTAGGIRGARQRGESYSPFNISLAGGAVGGAAGNAATPEDAPLDVRLRNIGLGATAGLIGGHIAGRGLGARLAPEAARAAEGFRAPGGATRQDLEGLLRATTQEPPAGGAPVAGRPTGPEPRNLGEVQSNPHLLREPQPGETPMTLDERLAHQGSLEDRFQANQDRLASIDEQLRNPGSKPERPPWAAGWSNDELVKIAQAHGESAYAPLWWERAGLDVGSGEVRAISEGGFRAADRGRAATPAELRREAASLQQDQSHIQDAIDQQYTAPEGAQFVKPEERAAAALPFSEGGGMDEGAKLAQQTVVTKGGTLTSDVNQVTGEADGITGRGIVNPAEVVHEPPSEETRALMPNLNAIGKDMPEIAAQIQKSVEDNPALWEHYKQGRISFDSLKNDLARRVGMSKEEWLKLPVGKALNDREMVALQAAMIESQHAQTTLAQDILDRGGVDALSPEQLAYALSQLTGAQRLAAVAKGAGSTVARSLNARKISFDKTLASDITAQNARKAAARIKAQAEKVATRAGTLIEKAAATDKEKANAVARARSEGAPKNIIDQIAAAYDELDRYNAMSLHEKGAVFDKLKAARDAARERRKNAVRGAPEELLSALKQELRAEQDNFAKRKSTWETMAFKDEKAFENMMAKRTAFRGGLYIEQQRKSAQLALKNADREMTRAFDAEVVRRGKQGEKAQKLLESMGGQEVTKDLLKNYLAALSDPDPMVAAKFLQSTAVMSAWKRATVLRLAGLVSSPITQLVNIGGNTAGAIVEVPTRALVVGIDGLRAAVTGGERQAYAGELIPMLKAYGPGALGQWDNAYRIMKSGLTPEQLADPTKITGRFSPSEKLNFAVEAPLRALAAEDALFRGAALNAHGMRVASRQAIREGFKGGMIEERAADIMSHLEDYPELAKEATDAAARQVFQEKRTGLGGAKLPDSGEFLVKQAVPFYRTPLNITAQGGAMSPLGFSGAMQSAMKARSMPLGTAAERAAQGRETLLAEERAARAVIGSLLLGGGLALGAAGHLTGAYPLDPKEASTLPQGWRPWSLRATSPVDGNTYYFPLQNLGPMGFPMAMAAIMTDPIHRGNTFLSPEEQLNSITAIGRYVLDNTFLQGLSDVIDTLHDPKTHAQKFGESLAASYGPYSSLGRELQRMMGTASRNPREGLVGMADALEANYPGLSEQVPEATTPLGEPRTQGATGLARAVPYRYDIERDNPTLLALRTADVGIPASPKTIATGSGYGIELTEPEQDILKRGRGAAIVKEVTRVRANPRVQSWERTMASAPHDSRQWQDAFTRYNDAMQVAARDGATAGNDAFLKRLGKAQIAAREKISKNLEPSYLGAPSDTPPSQVPVGEIVG